MSKLSHDELIEKGYRQYRGEGIDVYFNKNICIHAGVCTQTLPKVFDVKRKPWILPDASVPQRVAQMIRCCPSGALKFILKEEDEICIEYHPDRIAAYIEKEEVGQLLINTDQEELWVVTELQSSNEIIDNRLVDALIEFVNKEHLKLQIEDERVRQILNRKSPLSDLLEKE